MPQGASLTVRAPTRSRVACRSDCTSCNCHIAWPQAHAVNAHSMRGLLAKATPEAV
jgi:hypothetical protein